MGTDDIHKKKQTGLFSFLIAHDQMQSRSQSLLPGTWALAFTQQYHAQPHLFPVIDQIPRLCSSCRSKTPGVSAVTGCTSESKWSSCSG